VVRPKNVILEIFEVAKGSKSKTQSIFFPLAA
jgi:hypothetical protein